MNVVRGAIHGKSGVCVFVCIYTRQCVGKQKGEIQLFESRPFHMTLETRKMEFIDAKDNPK